MKVLFSFIFFSMALRTPHSWVFVVSLFYTVRVLAGSYLYIQVTQPAAENAVFPPIALMRPCSDIWISSWIKWQIFSTSSFLSDNILEWGKKENERKYFSWKMLCACNVTARILLSLSGDITMMEHWTCFVVVEKFMQDLKEHQKKGEFQQEEKVYILVFTKFT